jgi:hypothetical protein
MGQMYNRGGRRTHDNPEGPQISKARLGRVRFRTHVLFPIQIEGSQRLRDTASLRMLLCIKRFLSASPWVSRLKYLFASTMANSPNSRSHSPYFTPSPENDGVTLCPAWLDPPKRAPSRTSPRTQYEFIMSTGDESATSAKQKLKTVRSHVMKNYLHQQQQRQGQSGEASSRERRKAKQSVRSHRSLSRGSSACSPTESEGGRSGTSDVRNLFSDFAFASPSGESSATDYFSTGKSKSSR